VTFAQPLVPVPAANAEFDRFVWRSDLVAVGAFRCPINHPRFADCGPIQNHCFVFPRTSAIIEPSGHRRFIGDRGVVPLYNAGQEYRRLPLDPAGDHCDYFSVSPDVLAAALRARNPSSRDGATGFGVSHVFAGSDLYLRQRRVFREAAAAPTAASALHLEERVIGLLDDLLKRMPGAIVLRRLRDQHREVADAARVVLTRRFASNVTLVELSAEVGVSPFHLCRVFRAVTGVTLHQYRERLRLSAALERVEGDEDLTAIALDLGYSSHSHFTASFRRAFGVTPSGHRGRRVMGDIE
jgi:AraC-like DNA-binding protein